ncbi:MAG TPA: 5-oxoprolinase subunit PxpB [Frateuria sp.]|uniref:5-oxoprolinase subunit PxpB n=1 Tax=Frateuria sp. TaxID=2211372 RepID=UPI002D7FBFEE|nr:5-oxoprolinase subunit PxpB [Frateuria sp.]HET6806530.1 5-oxoprolinase subunit PxpB [Frateuria sp.]
MDFEYERMGEHALLLRLGEGIDREVNARVHEACARLRATPLAGVQELVPAYASVLVRLDPRAAAATDDPLPGLLDRIRQVLAAGGAEARQAPTVHRLPVCYGGAHGVDLGTVAQRLGMSEASVVARHCAVEYQVAMLGFAPGFAYLLGLDPALEVPRRERPRTRVPAGSVAIGGAQTGIYPAELPGGWQLIGRTPSRLFDAAASGRPCLLAPGDRVRFEPIDAAMFDQLAGDARA